MLSSSSTMRMLDMIHEPIIFHLIFFIIFHLSLVSAARCLEGRSEDFAEFRILVNYVGE